MLKYLFHCVLIIQAGCRAAGASGVGRAFSRVCMSVRLFVCLSAL